MATVESLLEMKNVTTVFPTRGGQVTAVNKVNLRIEPGEILGIVGESGCGKSTVLRTILGLISRKPKKNQQPIRLTPDNRLVVPTAGQKDIFAAVEATLTTLEQET